MNDMRPSISIVTVVYNDVKGIVKTIESIKRQSFKDFEYIIVDGLSTDGTSEVLSKNCNFIDKYICEKDNGITDAFNKGLKYASGKWIYFLNSGDYFFDAAILEKIYFNFLNNSPYDVISGRVKIVDSIGVYLGYNHPNRKVEIEELYQSNIIAHQASFVKSELFNRIGNFKNYEIHMDYDFWIRALKNKTSFCLIDLEVANFTTNGVSSQRTNFIKAKREMLTILMSYNVISKYEAKIILVSDYVKYSLKTFIRLFIGRKRSNLISINRLKKG
ncbi:glycosyltransferase family 2 protein [Flavobacterium fluviatile]|uniref:glycosyltransferase family 2 protein n=1 Tax=Flavobacterium fluviatile TaxID=1862387 RepID=UPI0013D06B16|nr:glycosyltransferase family 2 protein [Flavobacterium fluviatile]